MLLLAREHTYYPSTREILVYPSAYEVPWGSRDAAGIVSEGHFNDGEAWPGGPVVLAWDAALQGAVDPKDGRNVVLHEFAHKLDMGDGFADGTPPLRGGKRFREYVATMQGAYERLVDLDRRGRATVLDKYGATNAAEFFAVATEAFFEKPRQLARREPDLYAVLMDYYGQNTKTRWERFERATRKPS